MTDHEKRIREALEAGPQAWNYDSNMRPFYNDPEGNSRGGECDGTYALFGADFEIDGEVYEGPTLSERCKEADAKFIAACNPSAIRSILADLDAARAALSEAKAGGWFAVHECPDGEVWFALSCGHVVMGWKQGDMLDWEAMIDHDCCSDASAIQCQPVAVPAPPAQRGEG